MAGKGKREAVAIASVAGDAQLISSPLGVERDALYDDRGAQRRDLQEAGLAFIEDSGTHLLLSTLGLNPVRLA